MLGMFGGYDVSQVKRKPLEEMTEHEVLLRKHEMISQSLGAIMQKNSAKELTYQRYALIWKKGMLKLRRMEKIIGKRMGNLKPAVHDQVQKAMDDYMIGGTQYPALIAKFPKPLKKLFRMNIMYNLQQSYVQQAEQMCLSVQGANSLTRELLEGWMYELDAVNAEIDELKVETAARHARLTRIREDTKRRIYESQQGGARLGALKGPGGLTSFEAAEFVFAGQVATKSNRLGAIDENEAVYFGGEDWALSKEEASEARQARVLEEQMRQQEEEAAFKAKMLLLAEEFI
eukprot:Platyproteum_vivax@DN3121_c0_g1_i1.p1